MTPEERRTIRRFLAPSSIAIVGASGDIQSTSGRPLHLLRQHGFGGPIYPVNPAHETIAGLTCYPNLRSICAEVDLALVCVPATRVPEIIHDCRDARVPAAYVISSGFDEALTAQAGSEASRRLREAVSGSPTRISGPNGEGIYNVRDDIALGFSPTLDYERGLKSTPRPGNVAVVAQSGGLGFGIFNQGLAHGIDFCHVVSTGNEVDLGLLDYVDYLIDDEHTTVITLFIEGLDRPLALRDLGVRAAGAGKSIVVAKVGRSEEAQRAAVSHTGHLTGPAHLWSALFRQAGMIEATDIAELLDVVAVLARYQPKPASRVGVMTVSGGAGVWITDALRSHNLQVPELDANIQSELASFLPYYANTRNPVDLTAGSGPEVRDRALPILAGAHNVDVVVGITSLINPETGRESADHYASAAETSGKPVVVYSYTQPGEGVVDAFAEHGLPVLLSQAGVATALSALDRLARRATSQVCEFSKPAVNVPPLPASCDGVLHEAVVKSWLARCGLAVPSGRLVRGEADAVAVSENLGYPVVLKLQSSLLPHKSEQGVMALNLRSAQGVTAAYESIWRRAVELVGDERIDGVLVERMVPAGLEMLIGISREPALGTFLTVGAGGTMTEIMNDVTVLPAPATAAEVRAALQGLRCADALRKLDMAALCELAARVSAIGASVPKLAELDLNPVIVHALGSGVDIVDALATTNEASP
jgi:acyl-CoA synthetase (NDP forming)